MDFLKECFKENDGALMEKLKGAGFSTAQARQFLPEAASGFSEATQDMSAEQVAGQLVSDDPAQFLRSVNANAIAEKLGMNSNLVNKGLAVIAPAIALVFAQKSDGLVDAVTSLTPGLFKRFI